MFVVERLNRDSFHYKNRLFNRKFPEEFLIAVKEEKVIGYSKINVLDSIILDIEADSNELHDMLFRYSVATIESLGDDVFYFSKQVNSTRYNFSGSQPYDIDRFFEDNKQCK